MNAVQIYEALRTQVLQGQACPEGMGTIVFHGMLNGLTVLASAPPSSGSPVIDAQSTPQVYDQKLVHLLANMFLLTQSKVEYVY